MGAERAGANGKPLERGAKGVKNKAEDRQGEVGPEIRFNDETHINYQVLLKEMVPPLPIPLSLPTLAVIFSIGVHFTP